MFSFIFTQNEESWKKEKKVFKSIKPQKDCRFFWVRGAAEGADFLMLFSALELKYFHSHAY